MITHSNYKEVLSLIRKKDLKRLINSCKQYVVIYLSCSNCCAWVNITLTNDFIRYQYVSNNGNCILDIDNVLKDLLNYEIIKQDENYNYVIVE